MGQEQGEGREKKLVCEEKEKPRHVWDRGAAVSWARSDKSVHQMRQGGSWEGVTWMGGVGLEDEGMCRRPASLLALI